MSHRLAKLTAFVERLGRHRGLPLALALAAVVLMLPAVRTGLLGDDLVQRPTQLLPADLPAGIVDTGFVASDSGKLGTVLGNLFSYLRGEAAAARAKDYGIVPWWAHPAWQAALWRPLTAFTHWLDYRLYPDSPALMHAHSIAWYAAAVFLAAMLYRKVAIATGGAGLGERRRDSAAGLEMQPGLGAAALAAGLFLLDKNTYFPVMYVANRGFIVALVLGLLCLHAHLQWRTTRSRGWMWFSGLCLLLSLLANEGGASTLAFLVAYAVVLEPGGWRPRLGSLLPAAVVVVGWRVAYVSMGYGVRNFTGYIDPGYAPLLFLGHLVPRANGLLGAQLTGLPPETAFALSPTSRTILAACFAGFSLICAGVFLPVLRRDAGARFWAAAALLALVPAATVAPLSKNLGFVAVGAFGVMAAFLVRFGRREERGGLPGAVRAMSWGVAVWLVLVHIPGALAGRIGLAMVSAHIPEAAANWCAFEDSPEIGGRDVVVVSDPTWAPTFVPFDRAYRGQPLPRTIRVLVPGLTALAVERADACTLVLNAKGADLFDCPAFPRWHAGYLCKAVNDFLFAERSWQAGERVTRKGFVAEIREVSPRGAPRAVAFHFDQPLESAERVWLCFDWRRKAHYRLALPQVGQTVEIAGPGG